MKQNLSNISYRRLSPEEFNNETLVKVFEENNAIIPDSRIAIIFVAEDEENNIISFHVCQPMMHIEPIWVAKEYRNTILYLKMIKQTLKTYDGIKGLPIYAFSPKNLFDKTLTKLGFTKKDYSIFEKIME